MSERWGDSLRDRQELDRWITREDEDEEDSECGREMTTDRKPQVGDRFTWQSCSPLSPMSLTRARVVVAVTDSFVHWEYTDGSEGGVVPQELWYQRATLVPTRPSVRDCWGYIWNGVFIGMNSGENTAREITRGTEYLYLARIVNGVVCDEFGESLKE